MGTSFYTSDCGSIIRSVGSWPSRHAFNIQATVSGDQDKKLKPTSA
jgi:hypothetical protein